MKVILYGATGHSGGRILKELVARGHDVTAVSRNPEKLPPNVESKQGDLRSVDAIASVIAGTDAVISAYAPPPGDTDQLVGAPRRLPTWPPPILLRTTNPAAIPAAIAAPSIPASPHHQACSADTFAPHSVGSVLKS